jgi:phosphoglycolate phosphatase
MIFAICARLGLSPAQAAMVGDSTQDLRMGRTAGVGVNVGVCSGVTPAEALRPHADFVLNSIDELI